MARHLKRDFGGRSVREVHAEHAFPPNARCAGCRTRRPTVRAMVLMPMKEAMERDPSIASMPPASLHTVIVPIDEGDGVGKPYIRVTKVYSCDRCLPALEKQLAKTPSWAIVEINRGPQDQKIISS